MEPSVRKQLYITRAQDRALQERAQRERLSETALVRQAIDRFLNDDATRHTALEDLNRMADRIAAEYPTEPSASSDARGWTRDEVYEERSGRWMK